MVAINVEADTLQSCLMLLRVLGAPCGIPVEAKQARAMISWPARRKECGILSRASSEGLGCGPAELQYPARLAGSRQTVCLKLDSIPCLGITRQDSFGALGLLGKPINCISIVANLDESWLPPNLMT